MTESSRFFQGTSVGDAGPYSSDQFAEYVRDILHASARMTGYGNRGPFIDSGDAPNVGLQVVATNPASTNVTVMPGAAVVDGTFYINDADEDLAIAANASGNPRIDTIVLTKDSTAQTVRMAVEQGTPAATPAPPALTQSAGTEWQIPLADIAVSNGFVSITDTDITPRHEWANAADGVYLKDIMNNSGVTLETGDAVIWDTSADRAVTTTTTLNDPLLAGVWVGRVQDGDYGRVLVKGVGLVRTTSALARGVGIVASGTVRQFASMGTSIVGGYGHMLEASGAGELALAYIDIPRVLPRAACFIYELAQNTAGSTYAAGADRTVLFNTELYDDNSIATLASNQVTVAAGTYRISAAVAIIGAATGGNVARLILNNITAGADVHRSLNHGAAAGARLILHLQCTLTFTVATTLELRIRVVGNTTQAPEAVNVSFAERYNSLIIERVQP